MLPVFLNVEMFFRSTIIWIESIFPENIFWELIVTASGVFLGLYLQQQVQKSDKEKKVVRLLEFLRIEAQGNFEILEEITNTCNKIKDRIDKTSFVSFSALGPILAITSRFKKEAFEALKNPNFLSSLPVGTYLRITAAYARFEDIARAISSLEASHLGSDEDARRHGIREEIILADSKEALLLAVGAAKYLSEDAKRLTEEFLKLIEKR